jgi:hypothetical protein
VIGAVAVVELGRGVELLAADAVQAFVPLAVQVTGRGRRAPEPLHAGAVARVAAGADEVVEAERERAAQGGERGGVAVDEPLDLDAGGLGGLEVFQRVVVGAGEEPDRLAQLAPVPCEHVGLHDLQREPQVRAGVDVRDRGRDVEAWCGHGNLLARMGLRPQPKRIEAP